MTIITDIYKNKKYLQYAYLIGIVSVIVGSLGHFFENQYFKYLFAAGSLLVILSQLINALKSGEVDFRRRRLLRMNMMLSLMLALATYSMFDGTTMWVAVVLIYALVTLFMSFRL